MTRRGGPVGLAMLCVLAAGAAWGQEGPCPPPERALPVELPGKPTAYQAPWLDEASLSRQAWFRHRTDATTENFALDSREQLEALRGYIRTLQADKNPITKAQQRALAEALRLADRAIELHKADQASSPEMRPILTHLNVAAEAYGYEFIAPIPRQTPVQDALKLLDAGEVATGNLPLKDPPKETPFWIDPGKIADKDLYRPVRGNPIDLSGYQCEYDGAKTGYGTKGGFDIECKGKDKPKLKFKLKFGPETRAEPFNARIYNALGFNVPTVEYVPSVTLKYSRKIFSEFNCRQEITAYVAIGKKGVYKFPFHHYINPFRYVTSARLTNGTVITMAQLYNKLFGSDPPKWGPGDDEINDDKQDRPELDKDRYVGREDEIESVTMFEGSLEVKEDGVDSIGAWNWNSSVYQNRREVRGAAVLSMWLGNYDVRWDNNKVKLVKDSTGNQRLAMYISDIGAGLGNPRNIIVRKPDDPTMFPWQFTAGEPDRAWLNSSGQSGAIERLNKHRITIVEYLPDFGNETMRAVTIDDMKWMAGLIADLTENQIKAALIAANFQSAEVYVLTHKLLNRREHLLRDTGGPDTTKRRNELYHSHDPRKEEPMYATVSGKKVHAPTESPRLGRPPAKLLLEKGQLKEY